MPPSPDEIEAILVKFLKALPAGAISPREWLKLAVQVCPLPPSRFPSTNSRATRSDLRSAQEPSTSAPEWNALYRKRKNYYNKLAGRPYKEHRPSLEPSDSQKHALIRDGQRLDAILASYLRKQPDGPMMPWQWSELHVRVSTLAFMNPSIH